MADSDGDEYELPSLAERIQASLMASSMVKSVTTYDSSSEESEFLQFSERIRNTPCSQVKLKFDSSDSEHEESRSLKKKMHNTLSPEVKLKLHLSSSGSESDESEFLKFSERIRSTPQSEFRPKQLYEDSESDSDETFSNIITKFREINTPKSQNKYVKGAPVYNSSPLEKQSLSNSSNFLGGKSTVSEVSERIRSTPQSEFRPKQLYEDSESDSDETFSNIITKFREINTPKSQNKYVKGAPVYNSSPLEKQSLSNSSNFLGGKSTVSEGTSKYTDAQAENKKEYDTLFPTRSNDSLFLKKRAIYTKALFDFFNRKVFNYQLPLDLPLIWDESLIKTAGLTYCRVKKNVYSCSIKLSSKLLTSFDRLQNTLLHEMCHAAVWMINKQNVSHGPLWQLWASRSKLILPFVDCPTRCHTYDVPYRFWYQCTSCNWKRGTCRRIKRYHGAVCKRCNIPIILTVKN